MSLLSGLLDRIEPLPVTAEPGPLIGTGQNAPRRVTDRPRLVLVERPAQLPPSAYTNAATATPEWRHARDEYLNHIMACRSCYAPNGRHCTAGAHLRASYDATPMEAHQ